MNPPVTPHSEAITANGTPPTPPAPAAVPAAPAVKRRRPYVLLGLTVVGLVLAGWGGYSLWLKYTAPEPPVVARTGLEQEIVDAIDAAEKQVREKPRDAGAWALLGGVLRAHEFDEASNVCFAEAEKFDRGNWRWPYLLGLSFLGQNQDAALAKLRRAADLCGDEAAPRLTLAEVLLDRGETDQAEALFRGVVDKDPNNARALLGLGNVALRRDDVDGALKHLLASVDRAPGATPVHAALIQAYRRRGDDKAVGEEQRLLAGLPQNFNWPDPARDAIRSVWVGMRARMAQIDAFDRAGLRAEAVVAARLTANKYPDSALAYLVLGEMLNREGNLVDAERALHEAIRLDPKRGKAYFELGYAQHNQRKWREAIESYRRAIELQPGFTLAHYNLGLSLQAINDEAGAEKAYREAVRYRPEYVEPLLSLAVLYEHRGQHQQAMKALEDATRAAPADPRPAKLIKELREIIAREQQEKAKDKPKEKNAPKPNEKMTEKRK
jgi:tetratricopeptide (TPR) repeat protein